MSVQKKSILVLATFLLMVAPAATLATEGEHGPTLHPGFENGLVIGGGVVQSSLTAGDIDMDGLPELVVGGNEGILYAFNGDGSPVLDQSVEGKGIPIPAAIGQLYAPGDGVPILSSPTLADVDSDKRVDVFFGNDAGIVFRLEVVLSTDDEKSRRISNPLLQTSLDRFRRLAGSDTPDEDDDLSGR